MIELDKRIIDRKYIFDVFNADKAKEFIGEECYMTNDIELFKNLDRINVYKLDKIEDGFYNEEEDEYFDFCLPVRWLKPEEKNYRPCTSFGLHIGDLIRFRRKDDHNFEVGTMYMGYIKTNGTVKVLLGQCYYPFDVLFNDYEWFDSDSNTWKLFGGEK